MLSNILRWTDEHWLPLKGLGDIRGHVPNKVAHKKSIRKKRPSQSANVSHGVIPHLLEILNMLAGVSLNLLKTFAKPHKTSKDFSCV